MINTSSDPTYKLLWKYPAYKLVCNFANIYPNNTVVLDHLTPRMSYLCDLAAHNQKKKFGHGDQVLSSPAWNYPKMSLFEQSEVLIDTFPPKKYVRMCE